MTIYYCNGRWNDSEKERSSDQLIDAIDFILSSFEYERISFCSWKKDSLRVVLSVFEEK